MQALELCDALRTAIEALTVAPLSTFEVYVLDQVGKLPDERVILNMPALREQGRAISGGVGLFNLMVTVQMQAQFPATDKDANRDKAFTALEQLQKLVRDSRTISAGGDTATYASTESAEVGFANEGPEPTARPFRTATVTATWKVPGDTG